MRFYMNSDKMFSDMNQRPPYPTSHHGGLRKRQILCIMWVQKRNDLKQDARLLRHPQAFGVAKGLAPNKSSSTARDMTGLRAQLNHGGHCPPEFRESQYLSSQQNPHLTDYSVYQALCTAIPTLSPSLYLLFFFSSARGYWL